MLAGACFDPQVLIYRRFHLDAAIQPQPQMGHIPFIGGRIKIQQNIIALKSDFDLTAAGRGGHRATKKCKPTGVTNGGVIIRIIHLFCLLLFIGIQALAKNKKPLEQKLCHKVQQHN